MEWFVSWSGGKDSCLAYWRARQKGLNVRYALTAHERGNIGAHGVPLAVVEKQVESMGLELVAFDSDWDEYEANFKHVVSDLVRRGVAGGVFGDIDLQAHRDWIERVCADAGALAEFPLWGGTHKDLLREWAALGFRAVITAVDSSMIDTRWLGMVLDRRTAERLIMVSEQEGFSPAGESGEYHTLVLGGPAFSSTLTVEHAAPCYSMGHWKLGITSIREVRSRGGMV